MKKTVINEVRFLVTILLVANMAIYANAQKQPKIQEVSVRAPINLKIDGKLDEWNANLQAYNPDDRIFYAISNDDNNLYLAVRFSGSFEMGKFLSGGLTFTVSHLLEKKMKTKSLDNVSIKFPSIDYKGVMSIMGTESSYSNLKSDTINNKNKIDSIMILGNKKIDDLVQEIRVSGLKQIPDSIISIYNIQGIKAVIRFNKKMNIIYELAMPLKYLNLSIQEDAKFSYNVKLNPFVHKIRPGGFVGESDDPPNPNLLWQDSPSDFWGEYTLAKKP